MKMRHLSYYLKCGAKTSTFMFWAALYFVVMRQTVFKSVNTPLQEEKPALYYMDTTLSDWAAATETYLNEDTDYGEGFDQDNATSLELKNRAEKAQSVCLSRGLPTDNINNKEFFVDHVHNIVWCNIFKAASSFWLHKFNILGGYSQKFLAKSKKLPLELAREKFPRPSVEELKDAVTNPGVISLLIVREPFVRLLSAYRDKLEDMVKPFFRKLAKTIVSQHREQATKIFGTLKSVGPTFYEFVAYLIDEYRAKKDLNEHWAPYHQFCSPCAVNFSVIAKVETLSRDSSYVIRQLGLGYVLRTQKKDTKTRRKPLHVRNKSRDGRNTTSLLKYYFKQLDEKMLKDLLEIYGADFEMFGYDAKVYSRYVRK